MAVATSTITTETVQAALHGRKRDVWGAVFKSLLLASLLLALGVLVVLIAQILIEGIPVLTERGSSFLTNGTSKDPNQAGLWQALVGTFYLGVFVVVVAFPLGVAAALYLEEYAKDTRFSRFVNVNIRNLAGVPSIVYGILGFALFVKFFGDVTGGRSVIAGGLTLAVLVLPIVIITSAEALRAVPDSIREAGFGVGASRWEVIRHHVLPYSASGILTGTVLSLARALGEAAPLLLAGAVIGTYSTSTEAGFVDKLTGPYTALPIQTFDWTRQPWAPEVRDGMVAASIIVMLAVVLAANATAIGLRNHFDKRRHTA